MVFLYVCTHHMRLLSWLALRTCLAAIAGLVEELILSTAGILGTSKHATHLEGQRDRQLIKAVRGTLI